MRLFDWLRRRNPSNSDAPIVHALTAVPLPADATVIPVRAVPSTGDAFVDACLTIGFQELTDTRQWAEIPDAASIPSAANAGDVTRAVALAEALRDSQPDFYFSYYWLASLACERGYSATPRYDLARSILNDGFRRSKRKTELCRKRADIEWAARDVPEAITWWVRHAILQVSTGAKDETAFLYLAYVANAVGLPDQSQRFLNQVDRIVWGGMRLNAHEEATVRKAIAGLSITASVRLALELLDRTFLAQS